ncbi:sugar transferase [Aestuariimicrobium ganziense]|uniref:sugar transferase n=1 Tax=Aestuariimicrobium ganziense TaxID=2773677 RepID=UPI0019427390|nr:sugar transferase [Aestuariimicrobium ganziense]
MVVADLVLFSLVLWLAVWVRFVVISGIPIQQRNVDDITATFIYALAGFLIVSAFSGIYVLYNKTPLDVIIITLIDQILVAGIIAASTFAGSFFAFPRGVILINLVLGTVIIGAFRLLVYWVYRKRRGNVRVAVLTVPDHESKAVQNFLSNRSPRHRLTHVIEGDHIAHLRAHLAEFDSVHVSDQIDASTRRGVYDLLLEENKQIFLTADFQRLLMINPNIMSIEDESIVLVSPFRIPGEYELLKRVIDFLAALVLLVIASPVMLVAALLVKFTSPGPVLYKQVRVTKDNREFEVLKFRSMAANAEKASGPVLATSNDARVTTVGKYLRSMRIDELPQLINVLRGDMSLVGPRPERPFFVQQFTEINPHYPLRHNVRAGVTGYAQVYGKYASDFESKLNFDLLYIKRYTPVLDVKIMLQTVKILFDKVSSQGLDDAEAEGMLRPLPADVTVLR